jgi:dTDP-4-amino-4,6-dideoxygalactose transaminase
MFDRDTITIMGCNSRLDTLQAIVGNWLIPHTKDIANQRIKNAKYYDDGLNKLKQISIPPRLKDFKIVYHLYIVFAEQRDELLKYCLDKGIEAKVHYPVPIYMQPALKHLGHKLGDFPVTDEHTHKIISFPCDQHLSIEEMDYVIKTVSDFYNNK